MSINLLDQSGQGSVIPPNSDNELLLVTPAAAILRNYLSLCQPNEKRIKLDGQSEEDFITSRVIAFQNEKVALLDNGYEFQQAHALATQVLLAGLEDIDVADQQVEAGTV